MDKENAIKTILDINKSIIEIKRENPDNFFKLKSKKFKLQRHINNIIYNHYNSGPSKPSI
jgi:hypothetical protein